MSVMYSVDGQITAFLQVFHHLFQKIREFSAIFFVLLRPRSRALSPAMGQFALNEQIFDL